MSKICKVIILKVLDCFGEKQTPQRSVTLCAMNTDVLGIKQNHSSNKNRKLNMNDLTIAVERLPLGSRGHLSDPEKAVNSDRGRCDGRQHLLMMGKTIYTFPQNKVASTHSPESRSLLTDILISCPGLRN